MEAQPEAVVDLAAAVELEHSEQKAEGAPNEYRKSKKGQGQSNINR